MHKSVLFAAALSGFLFAAGSAGAAPVLYAANGHYYDYVATTLTWDAARIAAAGTSVMGHAGYLATVTSAGENQFLADTFGTAGPGNANGTVGWLGGSDAAVEGDWRWITGPEAGQLFYQGQAPTGTTITYADWGAAEPDDDAPQGEDYLVFRESGWNDLRATATRGYFIEYEAAAVPEPAMWLTMICGFALAGGTIRRRKAVARLV